MGKAGAADSAQPAGQNPAADPSPEGVPGKAKPDLSAAELDRGWGERPRDPDRLSDDDERLLRERPPHWGE